MAPFTRNPLYRTAGMVASVAMREANRSIRSAASVAFRRSTLGRLASDLAAAKRGARIDPKRLARVVAKYRNFGLRDAVRELMRGDLGQVAKDVERYSQSGGELGDLFRELMGALDPTARALLRLFGGGIGGPGGPGRTGGGRGGSGGGGDEDLERIAAEFLRSRGWQVSAPEGKGHLYPEFTKRRRRRRRKQPDADTTAVTETGLPAPGKKRRRRKKKTLSEDLKDLVELVTGDTSGRVEMDDLPDDVEDQEEVEELSEEIGRDGVVIDGRTYPSHHPVVTGREIITPDSSNVYSFSYDISTHSILIRFRAPRTGGFGGPGPRYRYRDQTGKTSPARFVSFMKSASAGNWVWDNLRVRGSVAAHQVSYELIGITDGYVPRQATLGSGPGGTIQESLRPRRVLTGRGQTLRSSLPTQRLRSWTKGAPKTGKPQGPNRGRPNTGRS